MNRNQLKANLHLQTDCITLANLTSEHLQYASCERQNRIRKIMHDSVRPQSQIRARPTLHGPRARRPNHQSRRRRRSCVRHTPTGQVAATREGGGGGGGRGGHGTRRPKGARSRVHDRGGGKERAYFIVSPLSLSLFLPEFSHIHLLTPSLIQQRGSPGKRRESRKRGTRRQPPLSGAAEVAGGRQRWHAPRAADAARTREQGSCPVAPVRRHRCRRRRHFAKLASAAAAAAAVAAHEGYRARTLLPRSGVSGGADGEQRSATSQSVSQSPSLHSTRGRAPWPVSQLPREVSRIDRSSRCQWCRVDPPRGPDHARSRTGKVMHDS